jgi:hypothetical protein
MRQHQIYRVHFRRGNASLIQIAALYLERYFAAWKGWASETATLLLVGRISHFGPLRAFALAAARNGWELELTDSTVLKVAGADGDIERFPALQFRRAEKPVVRMEDVERFYSLTAAPIEGAAAPSMLLV